MMRVWISFVVVLILSGCAASGPKFTEFAETIPALETQKARIFLMRPSLFVGSVASPDITLKNQNHEQIIGELPNASFMYFDVEPGYHTLRTTRQGSLGQSDKVFNLTHQFEEGNEYYFEITLQNADKVLNNAIGLGIWTFKVEPMPPFGIKLRLDKIEAKLMLQDLSYQKLVQN